MNIILAIAICFVTLLFPVSNTCSPACLNECLEARTECWQECDSCYLRPNRCDDAYIVCARLECGCRDRRY
jgi:hypothetical protein